MIRVLVAEDSVTARELLVGMLRSDPEIAVIGEAQDGLEAVTMTKRLRPDLVTMDIRMPRIDGFEATKRIMIEAPTPIVIVSGSVNVQEVEVSMHALRAGAVALLPKPRGPRSPGFDGEAAQFLATIKSMAQVKVVRHWAPRPSHRPAIVVPPVDHRNVRLIAIAASTGGPAALQRLLADLPGDLVPPIVVVQHIARGFVEGMARWLNLTSSLQVKVAEADEPLSAGTVYLAPDQRHLGVAGGRIRLSDGEPVDGFRPSASHLFASAAREYGPSMVAVILTGMGQDGLEGLRTARAAGALIVAQDEETSVVFGMPGVAVAASLTHAVLPLPAIAPHLNEICERRGTSR